jgi:signal transduction histidine kinase
MTLPLAAIIGLAIIINARLYEQEDIQAVVSPEMISYTILGKIEENYSTIADSAEFSALLSKDLRRYHVRLDVLDLKNNVLFSSGGRQTTALEILQEYKNIPNVETLNKSTVESYRQSLPIVIGEEIVGVMFVTINLQEFIQENLRIVGYYNFIIFGTGLILAVTLIGYFTWRMSRTILQPITRLNDAASRIAAGDLESSISCNDKTEIGKFCLTFDNMRMRLKDSLELQVRQEQERREMIAVISHDLRTPLASIRGYVEGIMDGVASEKEMIEHYIRVIHDKTFSLERLIEELFQYSCLELDEIKPQLVKMRADLWLEEIASSAEMAPESECTFACSRPFPEVFVLIDLQMMARVMDNLLENARRYAAGGGKIFFAATVFQDQLLVRVEDNGPGLAEADIPFLFQRFYRGGEISIETLWRGWARIANLPDDFRKAWRRDSGRKPARRWRPSHFFYPFSAGLTGQAC